MLASPRILLAFSIALLLFSCKQSKEVSSAAVAETLEYLSFQKTGCKGTCPVYKVEVWKDGTARYEGEQYVDRVGLYDGRFSQENLMELMNSLSTAGFWEMDTLYDDPMIMDVPAATLLVKTSGKSHKVKARFGEPETVRNLMSAVEAWSKKGRWAEVTD
ncbi:DUF6438 domain-containing protein [Pontibacter sp. G13]|uniref:DUF6438 domain-containing protein n=1 Tax=Pontibacter sp. G13 TaxID=3074898 RepID=UPI00288B93AC|nr:DUF6438 domain-containing protein [Pontibacter sp. G13]WNJ18851.1 DUF6438 domain-containing protein [Pontibacter sp. G13]